MRSFFRILGILLLIALVITGIRTWKEYSALKSSEDSLDGRLRTVVVFYGDMDTRYMLPLLMSPDLTTEATSALNAVHQALIVLPPSPAETDAEFKTLTEAQKKIHLLVTSQGTLPTTLTDNPLYESFAKESSNQGRASVLIKDYNDAVGAYNARIASGMGNWIGQWSARTTKQFLNIDGTLSSSTLIKFD